MEKESNEKTLLETLDIGFLTETERDMIIDVLRRDERLRTYEKKRVLQLKCELRDVRRKGAKRADSSYANHVCARCSANTGHLITKPHSCPICKHKVCDKCRVSCRGLWMCIVCFQESKIKAKTGEWFFDAMRTELKPMPDGSTLLKQAVVHTPSRNITSVGSMESLTSSTESHSLSSYRRYRSNQVETGSIESLRSLRYMGRDCFSDSDQSSSSFHTSSLKNFKEPVFSLSPTRPQSARDKGLTMPPIKPSFHSFFESHESISTTASVKSTSDSDNAYPRDKTSLASKSSSVVKKKFHHAGKKLQAQRILSRSVPSLAARGKSKRKDESKTFSGRGLDSLSHDKSRRLSMSTSNLDASRNVSSARGEIKFSLEYDYKENNLLVFIAECRNLSGGELHRKSCDPYVKCYLLPDRSTKRKTSSKKLTSSPKFDQELRFPVDMSELGNRTLEMSVWNSATFSRNSFLGHLQIGLDAWKWQTSPTPHWYPLKQKEHLQKDVLSSDVFKGDLMFGVSYKSPEKCLNKYGELHVLIKQAKNLLSPVPHGTVDSFVRVSILPEKDVQEKTPVVFGSVNPVWNAKHRLPLLHCPVESSGLEMTIWRKPHGSITSRKSRKLMLGGIRLASDEFKGNYVMDATEEENLIWEKICHSNGNWVDTSLSLR